MKPALLAACFATTAVASAELKDPATVAHEWEKTIAQAPAIKVPEPGLRNLAEPLPALPERTYRQVPLWDPRAPRSSLTPFDGIVPPSDSDPKNRPQGAKPYRFNNDTYWLIPLTG
jgi:hypothetical protein